MTNKNKKKDRETFDGKWIDEIKLLFIFSVFVCEKEKHERFQLENVEFRKVIVLNSPVGKPLLDRWMPVVYW